MVDVFISYARADRDRVAKIAKKVEDSGFSVWWDQRIATGKEFTAEIQSQIEAASAVLVIWSRKATTSPWVRDEATLALKLKKYVPAIIEECEPPLGFGQYQTADLSNRRGSSDASAFQLVLSQIRSLQGGNAEPNAVRADKLQLGARLENFQLSRRNTVAGLGVLGAGVIAVSVFGRKGLQSTSGVQPVIAVMPFENLSNDEENRFVARGIAEQILNGLAAVEGLQVIASASSFSLESENLTIPQIAEKLGAGIILDGSVRQQGNRMRVNAELSSAIEGKRIWSESYEGPADNSFLLQDEITNEIVSALPALIGVSKNTFSISHTTNTEAISVAAERHFVHATALADQSTENSMRLALENFVKAVELEPRFAQAWAELATTAALMESYAYPLPSFSPTPEVAAQKALAVNPSQAEAFAALGLVADRNHNNPGAIEALKNAIALKPSYSSAHSWLAWELCLLGDGANAVESAKRAVALNPLAVETLANLALAYAVNGQYHEAVTESRRMSEMQPDYKTAELYAALAYYHLGEFAEAERSLADIEIAWAGDAAATLTALSRIEQGNAVGSSLQSEITDPFSSGLISLATGDLDKAIHDFELVRAPLFGRGYWPILAIHNFFRHQFAKVADRNEFNAMVERIQKAWSLPPKRIVF